MKLITISILCFLFILNINTILAQEVLNVTTSTSDNGLPAHIFTWSDAKSEQRSAIMVDQRPNGAGYLREFIYKVSGVNRVCRGTGANGHEGDGYLQNHTVYGGDRSSHTVGGTTTLPLNGRHHAIIDFYMPNYLIDSPPGSGSSTTVVPSRVQWFFATGRNYPIFSVTQDARASMTGNLGADSRSPYGDFHYDGTTNYSSPYTGDFIGGASWGDTYKWVSITNGTTDESSLITSNSGWRYDESNSIPYAMQWTKNINAEMGHVLTQSIYVNDMGLNPSPALMNEQNLNGPMIADGQWVYQILNYGILDESGGVTKRLTWGTNWGHPGGFDEWGAYSSKKDFTHHSDGSRSDGMLLAYSVFIVLGEHTGGYKDGATGQIVKQMENMHLATLNATVGTVRLSGPAGVGLANSTDNNVFYVPQGYNHIYSTWEADADANTADLMFIPAMNAPIENPIFVINNFTASALNQIIIDNIIAQADKDYFATIDQVNSRVWITINKNVSNPLRLQVTGSTSNIQDLDSDEIGVFPNPTTGIIHIQNKYSVAGNIQITDNLGGIIKEQKLSDSKQIDISNVANGVYYIKILTEEQTITKRIIKENK